MRTVTLILNDRCVREIVPFLRARSHIEGYLLQDPAQLHVICDFKQTQFSIFPWFLE